MKAEKFMMPVVLAAFLAVALAGCGERAPRGDPEHARAQNLEKGPSPSRERTLRQGESERMSY